MKKMFLFFNLTIIFNISCFIQLDECNPHLIFDVLKKYLPQDLVIVEAGACDGGDTMRMAHVFKNGFIHSFEPVPQLFQCVLKNTQNLYNVKAYPYALSDKNGNVDMYISTLDRDPHSPSASSSLLPPKEHLRYSDVRFNSIITVPGITLDSWAQYYNVDHIDFMWLDMQGFELNVLKASPRIFKTVKAIFTEVSFVEAYAGQYLFEDVKAWLENEGFVMIGANFTNPRDPAQWYGDAFFIRLDN
ncbi:MAG: FkbM family methyltransferase [Candidatus Babeliaceae bacterium]|jgi:FkbM family methyltransferase